MSETIETNEIKQEVLNEALLPDLSQDTFEICGKTVKIKPLSVRLQIEFTHTIAPFTSEMAFDAETLGWLSAVANSLKHAEVIPKLIHILCKNDSQSITLDEIMDSDKQLDDMLVDLAKYAAKNQTIGKPITDFFTLVLPLAKQQVKGGVERMIAKLKEASSTSTV